MAFLRGATGNVVGFFLVGLVMVFTAVESAGSHQAAPAPAVDCATLVLNMADCLSFVTSGSTVPKPEGQCCGGLKKVLKTDSECLCEAFKNSAQLGVTLNVTKALSLPAACHVSAPSVSNCGLSIGSGAAPALSPIAIPPSSSSIAPSPFSGPSEIAQAPSPSPGGSSGSLAIAAASLGSSAMVVAAAAAWLSFF